MSRSPYRVILIKRIKAIFVFLRSSLPRQGSTKRDRKVARVSFKQVILSMLSESQREKDFRASSKDMGFAAVGRLMVQCSIEHPDLLVPALIPRAYSKAQRWAAIWAMSTKLFRICRYGRAAPKWIFSFLKV